MTGHRVITNGSLEVAAEAGVSYRQLGYWRRIGMISTASQPQGSGTGKEWIFTAAERRAVVALAAEVRELEAQLAVARSGLRFQELLRRHS